MPKAAPATINLTNSIFLTTTALLTLTAVPAYIWAFGLDWFQVTLFVSTFIATGISITLGYHRLFSHLAFKAKWPVKLWTLVFGAATFENSALCWCADHRNHHKHVDHDGDPYNINHGLFHAHIGWIMFQYQPPHTFENVKDLQQDKLVMWQHQNYIAIAVTASLLFPAVMGFLWNGWIGALGGFLIGGVARVVAVHHMTFCINSFCHYIGRQPYSSNNSARDSGIMALFTFGEGYHNFHHEFQHDYRNGVKPWQFDPTKWSIWALSKIGLASDLRRIPDERILRAEIGEQQRLITQKIQTHSLVLPESVQTFWSTAHDRVQEALSHWEDQKQLYTAAAKKQVAESGKRLEDLQYRAKEAAKQMQEAMKEWRQAQEEIHSQLAALRGAASA